MPFLSTYIDVRTVNFSHLLNPDWSIQIFRAPAACKVNNKILHYKNNFARIELDSSFIVGLNSFIKSIS